MVGAAAQLQSQAGVGILVHAMFMLVIELFSTIVLEQHHKGMQTSTIIVVSFGCFGFELASS